jgi:hypothetical protein
MATNDKFLNGETVEEVLKEVTEHLNGPNAHRQMTEAEELDDDAEGGYFQLYDENGDKIED